MFGRTTTIHAVVDELGNPLRFLLTSGQIHDSRVAHRLLETIDVSHSNVITDMAYGTAELRQYIASEEVIYTIPPKENAKTKWNCNYQFYC